MHEKDLGIAEYLDLYGSILDERQLQIMDMYFNEDYSLSEISEITGITRQGVSESVRKSSRKLREMDEKLHLRDRLKTLEKNRNCIADALMIMLEDNEATDELVRAIRNLTI